MFLEFYPNKVIESCPFNYGWIQSCYGRQAAQAVARHVVSCSGVTLGARNSMLVYVRPCTCVHKAMIALLLIYVLPCVFSHIYRFSTWTPRCGCAPC